MAVERKAEVLRACDERARGLAPEVAQVRIGYVEGRRQVEVFGSDGRAAADDRTRVRLSAQVVARRDGRVETGGDTRGRHAGLGADRGRPGGRGGEGRPPRADAARRRRRADRAAAGRGRQRASAACCCTRRSGTGSRPTPSRSAPASTPAGSASSSPAPFVTAYDDGRLPNEWGSDGIDDEGTPTQRTTVIEEGRLTAYLYDLRHRAPRRRPSRPATAGASRSATCRCRA